MTRHDMDMTLKLIRKIMQKIARLALQRILQPRVQTEAPLPSNDKQNKTPTESASNAIGDEFDIPIK